MALQIRPDWGKPISEYTESYGWEEAEERLNWIGDIQHPAQAAIERISRVRPDQTHGVTLSDLRAILVFSRSAVSYPFYASRPLIRGCIYLMDTIKVSGKASPFNYEYGYLCFRIMTIALGTTLLSNSIACGVGVEFATMDMITDTTTPIIHTLSRHVGRLMESYIGHAGGQGRETYNCILGWSHCQDHPESEEVVSRADAGILLSLLWDDRVLFLKAMSSTISPGLSGVMYVLWRYVIFERYLQRDSGLKSRSLMIPFVEVFWRAYIISPPDQAKALHALSAWNYGEHHVWTDSPKYSQLEDTKEIIRTFADQMKRADSPMEPSDIPNALNFVHQHSRRVPGCEVELPYLFGGVVQQMWIQFLKLEKTNEKGKIIDITRAVFNWFYEILKPLPKRCFDAPPMFGIITLLVHVEFIDLVARILSSLNPTMQGEENTVRNGNFLHSIEKLFRLFSEIVSKQTLVECFRPYHPDWLKYSRHLEFLEQVATESGNTESVMFYKVTSNIWSSIWRSLGSPSQERVLGACRNVRCADPGRPRGTEYVCTNCREVTYCGARCQAVDWVSGSMRGGSCAHPPYDINQWENFVACG